MNKLIAILYTIISPTMMGIFVVIALTTGHYSSKPIIISIIAGLIVAVPISWYVARQIIATTRRKN